MVLDTICELYVVTRSVCTGDGRTSDSCLFRQFYYVHNTRVTFLFFLKFNFIFFLLCIRDQFLVELVCSTRL